MGWPGLPGLCIWGSRYRNGLRGCWLMCKEMSVMEKLWGGGVAVEV